MPSTGRPGGALPHDFAAQLNAILAPGQEDAVAAVIGDAARLDDERLGTFLEAFAARVSGSSKGVTAAELDRLLSDARRGGPQRRTAAPSSSSRPRVPSSPAEAPREADRGPRPPRDPGPRTIDRERECP